MLSVFEEQVLGGMGADGARGEGEGGGDGLVVGADFDEEMQLAVGEGGFGVELPYLDVFEGHFIMIKLGSGTGFGGGRSRRPRSAEGCLMSWCRRDSIRRGRRRRVRG
jgi:hypothetical protein